MDKAHSPFKGWVTVSLMTLSLASLIGMMNSTV